VTATAQRQHYGLTLAALVVGALAYSVSQTMVAPALVDIQHALHTSTTTVTWVLSAFLLTASVATPLLGRLGDMFGKERVLLWAPWGRWWRRSPIRSGC
jgi:predicted MFS family arabinose efflux permease